MTSHDSNYDSERIGHAVHVFDLLQPDISDHFWEKGFIDTNLVTSWPEIVGKDIGSITRPVRIKHGFGKSPGGRLFVETPGSCAQRVQMFQNEMIERVNSACGYRAIDRISIIQTSHAAFAGGRRRKSRAAVPEEVIRKCNELVGDTHHEDLRQELMKFCISLQMSSQP